MFPQTKPKYFIAHFSDIINKHNITSYCYKSVLEVEKYPVGVRDGWGFNVTNIQPRTYTHTYTHTCIHTELSGILE